MLTEGMGRQEGTGDMSDRSNTGQERPTNHGTHPPRAEAINPCRALQEGNHFRRPLASRDRLDPPQLQMG